MARMESARSALQVTSNPPEVCGSVRTARCLETLATGDPMEDWLRFSRIAVSENRLPGSGNKIASGAFTPPGAFPVHFPSGANPPCHEFLLTGAASVSGTGPRDPVSTRRRNHFR